MIPGLVVDISKLEALDDVRETWGTEETYSCVTKTRTCGIYVSLVSIFELGPRAQRSVTMPLCRTRHESCSHILNWDTTFRVRQLYKCQAKRPPIFVIASPQPTTTFYHEWQNSQNTAQSVGVSWSINSDRCHAQWEFSQSEEIYASALAGILPPRLFIFIDGNWPLPHPTKN